MVLVLLDVGDVEAVSRDNMAFADIRLGPQPSMFHNLIVFTDSRAIDAKYDMGVDTVTDKPTATPETEWNEARIESSMAQLQEMHARVCTHLLALSSDH